MRNSLLKCTACGFVFMENIPTEHELTEYYKNYSYSGDYYISPITMHRYNQLLDEFEKYRVKNRILDIGCGLGYFLEVAKNRGWDVYGTEFSESAVKICESKGINIFKGQTQNSRFPDEYFDVVTSFEVLEHLNEFTLELKETHRILSVNGLFYCTTPNFNAFARHILKDNYNVICYPEHLSYFTSSTLKKLLYRHNFKCEVIKTTGFSVTAILNAINKNKEKAFTSNSTDEVIRSKFETRWYLNLLKYSINFLLNFTRTGASLKGYFIKMN